MRAQMGMGVMVVLFLSMVALSALSALNSSKEQRSPIDARVETRKQFLATVENCLKDWEERKATLHQIVARIKGHCEVFYPCYLNTLYLAETGSTMEERITQNLLRHLESQAPTPHVRNLAILLRLECENQ